MAPLTQAMASLQPKCWHQPKLTQLGPVTKEQS